MERISIWNTYMIVSMNIRFWNRLQSYCILKICFRFCSVLFVFVPKISFIFFYFKELDKQKATRFSSCGFPWINNLICKKSNWLWYYGSPKCWYMNATPRGGITWALYGMCISLKRSSTYGLLSQLRKHLMLTLYSAASSDFVLDLQFMTAGIVGV